MGIGKVFGATSAAPDGASLIDLVGQYDAKRWAALSDEAKVKAIAESQDVINARDYTADSSNVLTPTVWAQMAAMRNSVGEAFARALKASGLNRVPSGKGKMYPSLVNKDDLDGDL